MASKHKLQVIVLGPSLQAVSGVSTHLKQLFGSSLAQEMDLLHFQVGSEGRNESVLDKVLRFALSPVNFFTLLLKNRSAIVHVNTSLEPKSYWRDIIYVLLAKILGHKIIYQVHGGALPQDFFYGNAFLTHLLRAVLSSAHVIVLLAQVELKAYREFVPKAHLEVIANAIETDGLADVPLIEKKSPALQLVYIGRLAHDKGLSTILDAASILIRENRNLLLTIAGSGPEESSLRAHATAMGINKHVQFAGAVFDQAKNHLWQQSHIFVFPTTHREGLPYALLEAMAAGAVPIATTVGAIPDVMREGIEGLFVAPDDAKALADLITLLDDDRTLLNRLAQAGRQRILDFYTVDHLAKDFRRLYTQLAEKN